MSPALHYGRRTMASVCLGTEEFRASSRCLTGESDAGERILLVPLLCFACFTWPCPALPCLTSLLPHLAMLRLHTNQERPRSRRVPFSDRPRMWREGRSGYCSMAAPQGSSYAYRYLALQFLPHMMVVVVGPCLASLDACSTYRQPERQ